MLYLSGSTTPPLPLTPYGAGARSLIGLGVLGYIDDVLIYAETPEQLIKILSTVLKLLTNAGLKCKAS